MIDGGGGRELSRYVHQEYMRTDDTCMECASNILEVGCCQDVNQQPIICRLKLTTSLWDIGTLQTYLVWEVESERLGDPAAEPRGICKM
jgi:hypothetical protein